MSEYVPAWTRDADRALGSAMREVPLLGSMTPRGGMTLAEIVTAFEAGRPQSPNWTYAPLDPARGGAIAEALEGIADALTERGASPLSRAYAARARELALEALLAAEAGGRALGARARERFALLPGEVSDRAAALAAAWVTERADDEPADCTSDGDEPGSLISRLREEVGRLHLPFRVVLSPALTPLAATGHRMILVAPGRAISRMDVERTVLHEVEGHARPRVRAATLCPGLFSIGTARGADEQEGLALFLEERHGFLVGTRRRELALRHRAVLAMDDGATFVDTVRTLVDRDGAPLARAVAAAARTFRGSAGETAGLGRERVYLSTFVRVGAHLRAHPGDERVLTSGQVAIDAIEALAPHAR